MGRVVAVPLARQTLYAIGWRVEHSECQANSWHLRNLPIRVSEKVAAQARLVLGEEPPTRVESSLPIRPFYASVAFVSMSAREKRETGHGA